jgi:hypothetical protein
LGGSASLIFQQLLASGGECEGEEEEARHHLPLFHSRGQEFIHFCLSIIANFRLFHFRVTLCHRGLYFALRWSAGNFNNEKNVPVPGTVPFNTALL